MTLMMPPPQLKTPTTNLAKVAFSDFRLMGAPGKLEHSLIWNTPL
jgi:hypothetical protein